MRENRGRLRRVARLHIQLFAGSDSDKREAENDRVRWSKLETVGISEGKHGKGGKLELFAKKDVGHPKNHLRNL